MTILSFLVEGVVHPPHTLDPSLIAAMFEHSDIKSTGCCRSVVTVTVVKVVVHFERLSDFHSGNQNTLHSSRSQRHFHFRE